MCIERWQFWKPRSMATPAIQVRRGDAEVLRSSLTPSSAREGGPFPQGAGAVRIEAEGLILLWWLVPAAPAVLDLPTPRCLSGSAGAEERALDQDTCFLPQL